MKSERIKGFVGGLITMGVLIGLIVPTYAAYQKQAILNYTGITITLDGKVVNPTDVNGNYVEPFIMDGTTYLPVRGIASILGLNVDWNSSTNTVMLTTLNENPSKVDTTQNITTLSELQSYLNLSMGTLETPLGKCTYTIEVREPLTNVFLNDFEIFTRFDTTNLWYNLTYSNKYSDTEKAETLKVLREFQERIYDISIAYFPGKKITGCYYSSYYKYPNLQVGYTSTRVLTWRNYVETDPYNFQNNSAELASFYWYNNLDDYKFSY